MNGNFVDLGAIKCGSIRRCESTVASTRFRGIFGWDPDICCILWDKILQNHPEITNPLHLLYGLLFLKIYCNESVVKTTSGVDDKTFRSSAGVSKSIYMNLKS